MEFADRREAGQMLARSLAHYRGEDVVVYGVARGGVAVAAEIASYLGAPLDVLIACKIGHPMNPEYAIGAVTEIGQAIWNEPDLVWTSPSWRRQHAQLARREARRRHKAYRGQLPAAPIAGRYAIVVDDGIATGLTMTAALRDIHYRKPKSVVAAVPVAPEQLPWGVLRYSEAQTYVLYSPDHVGAVGSYYRDFATVSDEQVRLMLARYGSPQAAAIDVGALRAVCESVAHFPVSSGELADKARRLHVPGEVVAFFESIPRDVEYENVTDIMARADELLLLEQEEMLEPAEYLREEDI